MSWDVSLERNGVPVEVDRHEEGGTYVMGGTTRADLNVTYNYGQCFRLLGTPWTPDGGLQENLHGLTAAKTINRLEYAVATLGTKTFKDYWAPTPGNAGHALSILLKWAKQYPDAVWRVS